MLGGIIICQLIMLVSFGTWLTILGYQASQWLKYGEWPNFPIIMFLEKVNVYPQLTGWVGFDKIYGWILDLPISIIPFLMGVLCIWLIADAYRSGFPRPGSQNFR
jgi:hypothetical protein